MHYSKITGSWASLTAQNAADLDGVTFYIKSKTNGKYWSTVGGANTNNKRLNLQSFTGDTHQIYRFAYNSEHKFFYIQPAIGYNIDRRIAVRWVSGTAHAGRYVFLKDIDEVYRQQFWVVKAGTGSNHYKIIPRSSYGTMTVTNQSGYLNQYHTGDVTKAEQHEDVWILERTQKETTATYFQQIESNWCWVASAKMAASTEDDYIVGLSQASAVNEIKGSTVNATGTIDETRQAANYFFAFESQYYSETMVRRFVNDNHQIIVSLQPAPNSGQSAGHAITISGFEWRDWYGLGDDKPGFYYYYIYDPDNPNGVPTLAEYSRLDEYGHFFTEYDSVWKHSVVYQTSYMYNTTSFVEV